MNPERWERIARVYQAALEHPPAAREQFIVVAADGDEDVRREVESLLAEEESNSPLDVPVWETAGGVLDEEPDMPPGSRLGPYRIEEVLGIGGMGEVYRAIDTRLGRRVAIKILPRMFSSDRSFRERFEREAKAIAALEHPNICTLYDIGRERVEESGNDAGSRLVDFLVLEHVEGETLAGLLRRGALPQSQALQYAIEIADALAAAHRRGIVHRDLKPGNIMITARGAKLLDFGVAGIESEAHDVTTRAILGTFQYMAPEQLHGGSTDARSDIFSLGAVLYEMFEGRKAFRGIGPPTGTALDRIVRRCLLSDPDQRWQTAAEVRRELQSVTEEPGGAAPRTVLAAGIVTVVLLLGIAITWSYQSPGLNRRTYRMSVVMPEGSSVMPISPTSRFSISPDGRRLAFVATREDGRPRLFVRALDSVESRELRGTEGATLPFWSPDSASLGFVAGGALKRIDLDDSSSQTLADEAAAAPAAWNADGIILFTPTRTSGLHRVPASGGPSTRVTRPSEDAGEIAHVAPMFLPDRRHFLYVALKRTESGRSVASGTYIAPLDAPEERRLILATGSNVAYANEHLLFARESTLMAQPFDLARLELTGGATVIAEHTTRGGYFAFGQGAAFSASGEGTLAYQTGEPAVELVWLDRGGKRLRTIGEPLPPDAFADVHLSRDGRLAAVSRYDLTTHTTDLWRYDLIRGPITPLSREPADDVAPVFSPDGTRVIFASGRRGHLDLFQQSVADGAAGDVLLIDDRDKYPMGSSPDGRFVIYVANPGGELWSLRVADRTSIPLVRGRFRVDSAQFSPDGRWIVYASTESGRPELYATEFPDSRTRKRLTTIGADHPRWRADGKEIFFRSGGRLMAAAVVSGAGTIELARPQPLFDIRHAMGAGGASRYFYDVTPDGQRFLMGTRTLVGEQSLKPGEAAGSITVVVNWPAALRDRNSTSR